MATIQETQNQIAQARSQIATQRAEVEKRREEAKRQEELLGQAKSKLPSRTSQKALRSTMGGLQGRAKRQQIFKAEENIKGELGKVSEYKKGLTQVEQDLTQYEETQIKPVEAEIKRVQDYNAAVEKIQKAQSQGMVWAYAFYGEGIEKELAQKALKQENLARESLHKQVQEFQLANPTEKLDVDWKNLRIKGVQSGALGESLSLKEYNKKIGDLKVETTITEPTTLEGIKSNALVSDNMSLNISDSNKVNGFGSITGNVTRAPVVPSSELGNATSFFGRLTGAATKTFQKDQEYFNPSLNIVEAATYPSGQGSLSFSRSFTPEETKRFEKIQGNILTADLGRVQTDIKSIQNLQTKIDVNIPKIENLDKKIQDFENKYVRNNEFVGNQKEFETYSKTVEERNRLSEEVNLDSQRIDSKNQIGVGFFGSGGAKRDIRQFDTTKPISSGLSVFTETIGGTVENIAFLGGKGDIGKPFSVTTEQYGTTQRNLLTGKEVPFYKTETGRLEIQEGQPLFREFKYTEEDIRSRSKILGQATSVGVGAGLFLTPFVGTGLAVGMAGETLGSYGFSPSRFLSESTTAEKIEVGLLGAVSLGAGALRGTRIALRNVPRARYAGLNQKQYIKFLEKAGQDVSKLDEAEVRWLSIERKGGRDMELVGEQTAGGLRKEIRIKGELSKSELDKVILTGAGEYSTEGVVLFGKGTDVPKSFGFGETGIFETGSRGKAIPIGSIGDIQVLKQFGTGKTIPLISTRFGFQTGISEAKAFKQASKQFGKNIFRGGDITTEITEKTLFKFNEDLILSVGKKDVGLIAKVRDKGLKFDLERGGTLDLLPSGDVGSKILGGKKTPLSKTFQVQDLEQVKLFKTPPAPKSPIVKLETPTIKSIPTMTGSSIYAGTGLYERTEAVSVVAPEIKQGIILPSLIERQTPTLRENQRPTFSFRQGTDLKILQDIKSDVKQRQGFDTRPKFMERVKFDTIQRQDQPPRQKSKQEPVNVFDTLTRQDLRNPTIQKTPTKTKTPTTPKTPKTRILTSQNVKNILTRAKEKGLFEVFGRRKGKFLSLGTVETKEEAIKKERKFSLETLGATTFTKKGEKIIETNLGEGFRKSKVNPLLNVQERSRRLGTFGERREIKKSKSKKSLWGF